jgi:hypothetical protein
MPNSFCPLVIIVGSQIYIIAWQDSSLFQMLEIEKLLPEKYFFIRDEAFTNAQQFLSPWSGKWCIYKKLIVFFFSA